MAGFLKGGKFKPQTETVKTESATTSVANKPKLGSKKLGGLNKPKIEEPNEVEIEKKEVTEPIVEETTQAPVAPANKPKLGSKKLGGLKKAPEATEEIEAEIAAQEDMVAESMLGMSAEEAQTQLEEPNEIVIEENEAEVEIQKEVPAPVEKKKRASRKKAAPTKSTEEATTITMPEVDETRRISIEEMDSVMRPLVAPTTETWEQEKKDVLEALDNIKVEQDMTMTQVKTALAELDDIRFEVLPKQHDAETMYDGTKQNYDTVKAIAISRGSATNSEGRKAEGILACQNYVTPDGEVVDLHQYMLLIEERYKFYQKVVDTINFKKYSLVNYNNALKNEMKDL